MYNNLYLINESNSNIPDVSGKADSARRGYGKIDGWETPNKYRGIGSSYYSIKVLRPGTKKAIEIYVKAPSTFSDDLAQTKIGEFVTTVYGRGATFSIMGSAKSYSDLMDKFIDIASKKKKNPRNYVNTVTKAYIDQAYRIVLDVPEKDRAANNFVKTRLPVFMSADGNDVIFYVMLAQDNNFPGNMVTYFKGALKDVISQNFTKNYSIKDIITITNQKQNEQIVNAKVENSVEDYGAKDKELDKIVTSNNVAFRLNDPFFTTYEVTVNTESQELGVYYVKIPREVHNSTRGNLERLLDIFILNKGGSIKNSKYKILLSKIRFNYDFASIVKTIYSEKREVEAFYARQSSKSKKDSIVDIHKVAGEDGDEYYAPIFDSDYEYDSDEKNNLLYILTLYNTNKKEGDRSIVSISPILNKDQINKKIKKYIETKYNNRFRYELSDKSYNINELNKIFGNTGAKQLYDTRLIISPSKTQIARAAENNLLKASDNARLKAANLAVNSPKQDKRADTELGDILDSL